MMQNFSTTPSAMAKSIWCHRSLIKTLVQREVIGRYRGSFMGIMWSFFNPVLMLIIYTFVFSVIFKSSWSGGTGSKTEFAILLFPGLIVFNLFAECFNRAPGLILSNVNYVKKVVFPLEIFPLVSLGSSLFHTLVSFLVWLIAYVILYGVPHLTVFLLPVVIFPLLLLIMGVTWILASLGVFLRDVSQFIGILTSILMFLSPIFYPSNSFPEKYRGYLLFNPLTPIIENARDVLFWGKIPDVRQALVYLLISTCTAVLGFAWFQKTRKGFADVL